MTDEDLLKEMVQDLRAHIPGLDIAYKNESFLMKVFGFLLGPLNPEFMNKFATTWGNKVYFSNEKFVQDFPAGCLSVMAHEFIHLWDKKRMGSWKFTLLYASPQIYGLLSLAIYSIIFSWLPVASLLGGYVFCCVVSKMSRIPSLVLLGLFGFLSLALSWFAAGPWGLIFFIAALLPLGPWPSKGRVTLEARGYITSILMYRWLQGLRMPNGALENLVGHFTGPDYYFMSWNARYVRTLLALALADDLILPEGDPRGIIRSFLEKHGRIH